MAEFPSPEWLDEYVRLINDSADYREAAATWEGDITYVFEAEPDKGVPEEAMYVIANLAIGGDWPGKPDERTVFPGVMEVDWVRVYRRK